jgi:hypothetical protein
MADSNNSGQFGNRSDTKKQAQKGGKASKRRGGQNSHKND